MTDYRSLCAELLDELQYQTDWSIAEELKARARAALAEPQPPAAGEVAELVQQWNNEAAAADMPDQIYIATQAARWGADQELEACCAWIDTPAEFETVAWNGKESDALRAARRPKPPSLKELALAELDGMCASLMAKGTVFDSPNIRRALEALDD